MWQAEGGSFVASSSSAFLSRAAPTADRSTTTVVPWRATLAQGFLAELPAVGIAPGELPRRHPGHGRKEPPAVEASARSRERRSARATSPSRAQFRWRVSPPVTKVARNSSARRFGSLAVTRRHVRMRSATPVGRPAPSRSISKAEESRTRIARHAVAQVDELHSGAGLVLLHARRQLTVGEPGEDLPLARRQGLGDARVLWLVEELELGNLAGPQRHPSDCPTPSPSARRDDAASVGTPSDEPRHARGY